MNLLDPRDLTTVISHEEALAIARQRHGRPFRCQQRKEREAEPSRDLRELESASRPLVLVGRA